MNILAGLETFLYVISSALFYPVVAGLALLTFWIVIFLGGFLREYLERRQGISHQVAKYKKAINSSVQSSALSLQPHTLDLTLERLLQETELALIKSLDKIRFAIRVGPALGLMGTLIPMGIALSALAQGDMPKMAGSMVTAFTTTVVGLACGLAAYLMSMIKEKWVRADMREMEYMTELVLRRQNTEHRRQAEEEEDEISEKTEKI